jgi:hypothetical protein
MKFEDGSKRLAQEALNNIESNSKNSSRDFLVEETELDPKTDEVRPIKGKLVNAKEELLDTGNPN